MKNREILFNRNPHNPILQAGMWPYDVSSVFNAGAVLLPEGETVLLVRVEDRRGLSHLSVARSKDGVGEWQIEPEPALKPDPASHPEELWGLEDPRIAWLRELSRYAITYTSFSRHGPCVSLALTEDFQTFERKGLIMPPDNKHAALFPARFDGRWAMLHSPGSAFAPETGQIWLSFSPDLRHWGDHRILLHARQGAWWDAGKLGVAGPPIETPEGWLLIYHGMKETARGARYRLGAALLDREDPARVKLRGNDWLLTPQRDYERTGDMSEVVFPCGYTIQGARRDCIFLYYGAADTCVALAQGRISTTLAWLQETGRPGDLAADEM